MITRLSANASVMPTASASPVALPPPGAPSISATPPSAIAIASAVRRPIASPRKTHPSSAASTGDAAMMNSTRATDVWLSAAMKPAEAAAMQTATPSPATPIERHAARKRPRSATATKSSSAIAANTARPATWVAMSTDSWRCITPAVDHAIAASAT